MNESDPKDDYTRSVELVRRAQGGEHQALNRLFERYYDRVRRIVRMRLGPNLGKYVETEDILQETFIAAVHGFDKFEVRDEAGLILWLSKIAEHQIQNAAAYHGAQKRDRRREVALRHVQDSMASGELVMEPSADSCAPIDAVAQAEDIDLIETCIGELREDYRNVILHRDYAGASWAAVAELIDSPTPDAARSLYTRAVTELASIVRRRAKP
jgi:RNA polymerase sigma-70 factor (subfamily 1)